MAKLSDGIVAFRGFVMMEAEGGRFNEIIVYISPSG